MATAPIADVTGSRTTGPEAGTAQFQRLQRVRARQRSRRQRSRLMLATPLAVLLAGAAVVLFADVLGASLERSAAARIPARHETATRPSVSPSGPPHDQERATEPPAAARRPPAPARPRAGTRETAAATRRAPTPAAAQHDDAAQTAATDSPDAQAPDPATAIDWLLSRTRPRGHE
jgi:hypothetical protein